MLKNNLKIFFFSVVMLAACAQPLPPHQPKYNIVKNEWQQVVPLRNARCTISSGRNALSVSVNDSGKYIVSSTRFYIPGTLFTIRMGTDIFRTYDMRFTPEASQKIVDVMLISEKIYVEWTEPSSGSDGTHRSVFRNIVSNEKLKQELDGCAE